MFPFPAQTFPYRQRRDLAHAAQLQQLSRQNSAPAANILNSMYGPPPGAFWPAGLMRPYNATAPVLASPFAAPYTTPTPFDPLAQLFDDRPTPVRSPSVSSVSSFRQRRRSPPPQTPVTSSRAYRRSPPRRFSRSTSLNNAWPQAARSLHDSLKAAVDYTATFETVFEDDVRRILLYCDPALIPHLWTAIIDWDGVVPSERKQNPDARPRPDGVVFRKYAQRILEVKEDFEAAGFPSLLSRVGDGEAKLAPEDVRTTMEKLGVSLRAIESLLVAVRRDRSRFVALVRELSSAHGLISELKELWEAKKDSLRFDERFRR
nr:hypothetical protein B0A51_15815 [Rachicladosporium sp. CCFEE 5018]